MKIKISLLLIATLATVNSIAYAANTPTMPGTKCPKLGQIKIVKGTALKCEKVKGKFLWVADKKKPTAAINQQKWQVQPNEIVQESAAPVQLYSPEKTVKIGESYRSYFVSKIDNYLVFNESIDGITYSKQVKTNLQRAREIGTDTTLMDHPVLLPLKNGKFLLVYDICTGNCDIPPSLPRRLVYRFSDDGITWGQSKFISGPKKSGLNPEGKVFDSVPTLLQLSNGDIRLYYVQGGAAIGSALSKDGGASWQVEDGFRLGTPYGSSPKTESFIDPVVIQDSDGTVYLFFGYVTDWNCMETAGTPNGCVPLRVASSSDGLSFNLLTGNVITPPSGATQIGDPDIFIGPDGNWRILFANVSNNNKQFSSTLKWATRIK